MYSLIGIHPEKLTSEKQDEYTVESKYDELGRRIEVTSSLGAAIKMERNGAGLVSNMIAANKEGASWQAQFMYNALGQETERLLPGGISSTFEYDRSGHPADHKIRQGERTVRHRVYTWNVNDRLQSMVNRLSKGQVQYGHDDFGNLAWAKYEDGQYDYRLPDKVGNLYKTKEQKDRKYGPGGRLLESEGTKYDYDEEGNLISKVFSDGKRWLYAWAGNGMLQKVTRPDGKEVSFEYDALGRRTAKLYNGNIIRWVWDGNMPLHEWKYVIKERPKKIVNEFGEVSKNKPEPADDLITWIFDEGTFKPAAKVVDGKANSIITDYLGTPVEMCDSDGRQTWSVEYDVYGKIRKQHACNSSDCPFRYQGQYEDVETGLYYNRFRYYSSDDGIYISQDPIRLNSEQSNFYTYVGNANIQIDPFGLSESECQAVLRRLQSEQGPAAHFYERHRAQTTLAQQEIRALTGLTPDNFQRNKVDSTRFLTHADQLEAAQKAIDFQRRFGTGVGNETINFNMQRDIGEGFLKDTSTHSTTESVRAYFTNGKLNTLFPTLRSTIYFMKEININIEDVAHLFIDFIGGADFFDDEQYEQLKFYNFNSHDGRLMFIRDKICPVFENFSDTQKEDLKNSLWFYKNNHSDKLKYFADRNLFPFEFPSGKNFLEEIWFELFKNEVVSLDGVNLNVVE